MGKRSAVGFNACALRREAGWSIATTNADAADAGAKVPMGTTRV